MTDQKEDSFSSKIPKKISKYRIDGILGQGAMGIVYLGFDESIERKVAIKTTLIDSKDDKVIAEYAERFLQEAKSLAQCTHPNIVTILEFGYQDEQAYMVMEYVEGDTLTQLMNAQSKLRLMQVMSYFTQLLKALHVAHKRNIVHRDIKPDNVLLVNTKLIKLTDFGVAKSTVEAGLTQIGMTVGTPRYMAPEQLYGSEDIGAHTDIYCLFVLLYEMLAYIQDGAHYQLSQIPTIPQLAKHNKFSTETLVPASMIDFITKGLKVSHVDRFQNVQEVVTALKPILAEFQQIQSNTSERKAVKPQTHKAEEMITDGTIISQPNESLLVDDEHFSKIRDDLSDIMGPMADFIITQALKYANNHEELIQFMAEKIENNELRQNFANRWMNLG